MAASVCTPTTSPNFSSTPRSVRPGVLVYQPVLLAVAGDGRILLEVHQDIYGKGIEPRKTVREMAEANGLDRALDWSRVDAVIAAQEGLAREVGRLPRNELKGLP